MNKYAATQEPAFPIGIGADGELLDGFAHVLPREDEIENSPGSPLRVAVKRPDPPTPETPNTPEILPPIHLNTPRKTLPSRDLAGVNLKTNHTILGKGGFGEVELGQIKIDGETYYVAVKKSKAKAPPLTKETTFTQLFQDVPFIIQGYPGLSSDSQVVLDQAKETLLTYLKKVHKLPKSIEKETLLLGLLLQFGKGIDEIHKRDHAHLDVKPDNALMLTRATLGISDFGMARATQADKKIGCEGTPYYMAPELLALKPKETIPSTNKPDLWSFAVSAIEILTGEKVFNLFTSDQTENFRKYFCAKFSLDFEAHKKNPITQLFENALLSPIKRVQEVAEFIKTVLFPYKDALKERLTKEYPRELINKIFELLEETPMDRRPLEGVLRQIKKAIFEKMTTRRDIYPAKFWDNFRSFLNTIAMKDIAVTEIPDSVHTPTLIASMALPESSLPVSPEQHQRSRFTKPLEPVRFPGFDA